MHGFALSQQVPLRSFRVGPAGGNPCPLRQNHYPIFWRLNYFRRNRCMPGRKRWPVSGPRAAASPHAQRHPSKTGKPDGVFLHTAEAGGSLCNITGGESIRCRKEPESAYAAKKYAETPLPGLLYCIESDILLCRNGERL